MSEAPQPVGGRRAAETTRRRWSPLTILAVVIPLLTVAALALVRPADLPVVDGAPSATTLSRSALVCPPALGSARRVSLASIPGGEGPLALRVAGEEASVALRSGVATRGAAPALIATGTGDLAPGLVGSRAGGGSATTCVAPEPEAWFTGAAGGATHSSVLVLSNPDRGPAVADVTVYGGSGVLDVPALRGVRIGGGRTVELNLADVVPTREALALHVVVSRGRLGAHVVDVRDPLGRDVVMRDWLPSQPAPEESSYVVGASAQRGVRTLTLANPGDSEVRVETRLVTGDSEFVPSGAEEIRLRPESVVEVDITRLLRGEVAQGLTGLRLDASGPVTASLSTIAGSESSLVAAGPRIEREAGMALPVGAKQLVVAGASAPGVLVWHAWDETGDALVDGERVEVDPGTSEQFEIPRRAVRLSVTLARSSVVGSVVLGPPGRAVLPLTELVTTSEVPYVQPALR